MLAGVGGGAGLAGVLPRALARDDERRLADRGLQRRRAVRPLARDRRAAARARAPRRRRGVARCRARVGRGGRSESRERSRAIGLALLAAVALGVFIYFLGLGSREGDALSTLVGARVGSLVTLLLGAAVLRGQVRVPRASLAVVAGVGLLDVGANALFAFASGHGLLSIVSVLGSLYPVTTVLLAYVFLHERLTRVQRIGVALALAGVAVIAGAR